MADGAGVAAVHAVVAAINHGDWDEVFRHVTPEFEVDNSTVEGEWRGVHRGREGVRALWAMFTETWESVRLEIEDLVEAEDSVVTPLVAVASGRNGIEVKARTGWCWHFHEDLIDRVVISNSLDDAYAAAGLDPP